jgi:hypothetical protein
MSKPEDTQLTSIDASDLAAVTGGSHVPGHNDAAVTTALTSIKDSLSGLQTQKNSSGTGIAQLLPFMMLAKGAGGGCPGGNCCR